MLFRYNVPARPTMFCKACLVSNCKLISLSEPIFQANFTESTTTTSVVFLIIALLPVKLCLLNEAGVFLEEDFIRPRVTA